MIDYALSLSFNGELKDQKLGKKTKTREENEQIKKKTEAI